MPLIQTAPPPPTEGSRYTFEQLPAYRLEKWTTPRKPGFTFYRILGRTASEVQQGIDALMASVDPIQGGIGGSAQFCFPTRLTRGGWYAIGTVQVTP